MDQVKEVTASQACRQLGITLDALYRLLYAGKLDGRKCDGIWRIPEEAVEGRMKRKKLGEMTTTVQR
jgi:excisionase family DNA binding protein